VPPESPDRVLRGLWSAGVSCYAVENLCRLAAREDPMIPALEVCDELVVVACLGERVRRLIGSAGGRWDASRMRVLEMATTSPREVVAALAVPPADPPAPA
ncbi:MAG: hypothetical protein ACOC8F_05395, partial [Planctomycetota bacterium]